MLSIAGSSRTEIPGRKSAGMKLRFKLDQQNSRGPRKGEGIPCRVEEDSPRYYGQSGKKDLSGDGYYQAGEE